MFALNEGYRWQAAKFADALHGVVYLPQGIHAERMRRSVLGDHAWQLIDPQLYLAGLDCTSCRKVCARLATYSWFGVTALPDYDSGDGSLRGWLQQVEETIETQWPCRAPTGGAIAVSARAAVEFQADSGCSHIILPAPMITDREDEAEVQGEWIDAGLEAVEELEVGQPVVATVALEETVLNDAAFEGAGFLDTVVDQVSARDGVVGAYVVIAQVHQRHPMCSPRQVTKAYAHLTKAFARRGYSFVFVNFADVFGLACVGLGATGFASGPSQSLRRLCLKSFQDDGGGTPLPRYYSHRSLGEFRPERDLAVVVEQRLLRRVRDKTEHSASLLKALSESKSAANVAAWVESRNNLAAACSHFLTRMMLEGTAYLERTASQRRVKAEGWLEDAMVEQDFLKRRLENTEADPVFADAALWLDQFRGQA